MLYYCKKCGRMIQMYSNDEKICDYCQNIVIPVPDEYTIGRSKTAINKDLKEQFINEYIKSSPEFDQYLFDHKDEDLHNRRMENKAKLEHGKAILEEQSRVPKCPTCGSTNLKKISGTSKAVSVVLFGLLSTKRHKIFKCCNCGYEW